MQSRAELLRHAQAAVERTSTSLGALRAHLEISAASMNGQRRLIAESVMHDLSRRHAMLGEMYQAMIDAPESALPALWQRFFASYDSCLEAIREARHGPAWEEHDDTGDGAPRPAQPL